MNTRAFVFNEDEYQKKLADAANIFPLTRTASSRCPTWRSARSFYGLMGCSQCHSIKRNRGAGPDLGAAPQEQRRLLEFHCARLHPRQERRRCEVERLPRGIDPPSGGQDRPRLPEHHALPGDGLQRSGDQPAEACAIVASILANKPTSYKEKKLVAIVEYIKSLGDDYKPMKTPGHPVPPGPAAKHP